MANPIIPIGGAVPEALAAINTLLQYGDGGSPEIFTTLANVGDIAGPKMGVDKVDTTSHSTGKPWDTSVPTILHAGTIQFPLFYVPQAAVHQFLLNDFRTRTTRNWRLTWPDTGGDYWQAEGYVTDVGLEEKVKDVIRSTTTITFRGEPIMPTTGTPE